jgi:hypothetical protein
MIYVMNNKVEKEKKRKKFNIRREKKKKKELRTEQNDAEIRKKQELD